MAQPAEEIERIAAVLGSDYLRSLDLSEANVDIHYTDQTNSLVIFNGTPDIATSFEGAEPIDIYTTEIYFLIRKTKVSQDASDTDEQLAVMKALANSFYFALLLNRAIESYTLEGVEIGNDLLLGYKMTIDLPFTSNVCTDT